MNSIIVTIETPERKSYIQQDSTGVYYFVDKTKTSSYGPYSTWNDAFNACSEYLMNLDGDFHPPIYDPK